MVVFVMPAGEQSLAHGPCLPIHHGGGVDGVGVHEQHISCAGCELARPGAWYTTPCGQVRHLLVREGKPQDSNIVGMISVKDIVKCNYAKTLAQKERLESM